MQNSGIFACRNIYNLILRSRRLELVGARKNGAREGDTQGERELPLPSRVFRALVFLAISQLDFDQLSKLIIFYCTLS